MPRRFRPRRRPRRRRARISRTLTPYQKLIKCKVVDSFAPTYTSGALTLYTIQGNSIDDPYGGQSTAQPLGYDQWKTLYKKAKVLGCKVTYTVHNGSNGAIVAGITPMPKNQSYTPLANFEYYMETPGTRHQVFSPDVDKGIIVSKRSTKKMLHIANIKDAELTEIDLVNETPPTDLYWFHVWSQPFDQSTALTGVQLIIQVDYVVMLLDPIVPARSVET